MKRTLIYLMTLLALSFLISGCEIVLVPKPVVELPKAPSPIEVAVAAYETVDYSERFIGRVAADQNAVVYPRTTGKITAVYVSQGSNVWRNQALIKLDDSYVQDSIRQAESALSIAQANYDQTIERQESMIIQTEAQLMMAQDAYTTALSNLRDMEELQKTQDVPEMLVTQVKSAFVQAQGNLIIITDQAEKAKSETGLKIIEEQIKQAEHAVEQATRALNDTTVYAPVAGQVVQVNARVGDMAAPQMPLVQIINQNKVYVTFFITDNSLRNYQLKQELAVHVPSLDEERIGTITFIAPAASEQTLTFMVEVELENSDNSLKSGMLVETRQLSTDEDEFIVIPTRAVMGVGDESYVFVVEDGKAIKRPIDIIEMRSNKTVIRSGIEVDEVVVTKGQYVLEDGAAIEIID